MKCPLSKLSSYQRFSIHLQREAQKLADAKAQLQFMTNKEAKAREELAECQKKAEEQRKKSEEKVLSLQKDKFQLSDDLEKV